MKAPNYVNNVFQFRGLLPTLQANIGMPYFSFCPEDRLDNALQRNPLFSAGASARVQARQTFPLEWYCLRERITVYRLNSFSGSLPLLIPYRPIKPSNGGATKAFFFLHVHGGGFALGSRQMYNLHSNRILELIPTRSSKMCEIFV
jgi:acetyl esterase/lipase